MCDARLCRAESRTQEGFTPSEAEALWLLDGWPRKLVLSFSNGSRRLLLPALSKDAAGPDAAGRCLGKPVSTLMDGAAPQPHQPTSRGAPR